jgi:hypothetical protein
MSNGLMMVVAGMAALAVFAVVVKKYGSDCIP